MTQFDGELSPPFEIVEPAKWRAPIIFNSPHSGSVYPREFLLASRIDLAALRRSEDSFMDELIGGLVRNQLIYYPTVTRDPFRNRGRITDLITSGKLFSDAGVAPLQADRDRVMICGSPALVHDTRALLLGKGFREGNHGEPGQFVVEKAFAER